MTTWSYAELFFQLIPDYRIDPLARPDRVRKAEADNNRYRRNDQAIRKRFQTDAPELSNIADPGHADHERCKNKRNHDHQQKIKKDRAHRLGYIGNKPNDIRMRSPKCPIDPEAAKASDKKSD